MSRQPWGKEAEWGKRSVKVVENKETGEVAWGRLLECYSQSWRLQSVQ